MKPVIGIFGNTARAHITEFISQVLPYLKRREVETLVEIDIESMIEGGLTKDALLRVGSRDMIAETADVIMTFGGDGTMLAAAQHTLHNDTPLLGINLGKLGFLADINANEIEHAIDCILRGEYEIEQRMTLEGMVHGESRTLYALNDVVLSKGGSSRVITIQAYIDNEYLASFIADGVIISSPTGSTAYSLATGGPIVVPDSDVIIISPISAHTLTARPIIIPGSRTIYLHATTEEGSISVMADGQMALQGRNNVGMNISKGKHSIRLVKKIGPNYYEMLRRKLRWAEDSRLQNNITES